LKKNPLKAYNVLQSNHFAGAIMGITSVRLQPEIESPLEDLSKKLDRSKSYLINQAVKEFLARKSLEEQRWVETLEAIDSVKSGKLIEEKEVNDWLESWGTENELEPPNL
jgi:predicted transcriptional regulator